MSTGTSTDMTDAPAAPVPAEDFLRQAAVPDVVIQVVTSFLIAGIASGRANGHVLSPAAVMGLVAGAAAFGVIIGWPNAVYSGGLEVLEGRVAPCCPDAVGDDLLAPHRLWSTIRRLVLLVGLWGAAAAGLVLVALDGRRAGTWVLGFVLAGVSGTASVAISLAGRRKGVHVARRMQRMAHDAIPTPLRERAWRQLALPMAVAQALANGAFAWILFHDYTRNGDSLDPHALTRSVALADAGTVSIGLAALFGYLAVRWGRGDALARRVDVAAARTGRAPIAFGPQAVVYVGALGIVVAKLLGMVLPKQPALWEVMAVRGVLAGLLTFGAVGLAYVRGALNAAAIEGSRP